MAANVFHTSKKVGMGTKAILPLAIFNNMIAGLGVILNIGDADGIHTRILHSFHHSLFRSQFKRPQPWQKSSPLEGEVDPKWETIGAFFNFTIFYPALPTGKRLKGITSCSDKSKSTQFYLSREIFTKSS